MIEGVYLSREYYAELCGKADQVPGLTRELAARDQTLAEAMAEVEYLRGQLDDLWRAKGCTVVTINVAGVTPEQIAVEISAAPRGGRA